MEEPDVWVVAETPRWVVKLGRGMEVVKRENIGGWTVSLIKCVGARAGGDNKKQCNDLSRGAAQFVSHFELSSKRI